MTDKKRRQRGSRTHGGGSQKNRRGAGHRGGRGRAGRDKHEFHQYEPLGKHGFDRPEKAKRSVETVNLREIDENIAILADDGLAEQTDDGYAVDARDLVDNADSVDAVKLLAAGQLHTTLDVTADAFSEQAREQLDDTGGDAILSERGEALAAEQQAGKDTTDQPNEEA